MQKNTLLSLFYAFGGYLLRIPAQGRNGKEIIRERREVCAHAGEGDNIEKSKGECRHEKEQKIFVADGDIGRGNGFCFEPRCLCGSK